MSKREFSLKYGKGEVNFALPEEQVLMEIKGNNVAPPENLRDAYLHALNHPIDSPPLDQLIKAGDTVCILVSDITRAWQKNADTLPILLDYLNDCGVSDEDVTVIIAVGAHRQNTEEEFVELCSAEVCHRVRVLNNNAWDTDNYVYMGKTSRGTEVELNKIVAESDKLIMTGGVIYHYMVGYGGGRKSILPGVSSLKTIQQNHMWAMMEEIGGGSNPGANNALTFGNPVHEDMMEIAAFANPTFIVNVVPNLDGEICGIFAGNWVGAWWEATKLVDHIFGVDIDELADIVISTAGGYPRDINLYQTQKTLDNAVYALKPGGTAIILSEAPDVTEPGEFFDWFDIEDRVEMEIAVRKNYLISGWVAVCQKEYASRARIILVTLPQNKEYAKRTAVEPVSTIEEALKLAYESCKSDSPKFTIMPQGANTFPIYKPGGTAHPGHAENAKKRQ